MEERREICITVHEDRKIKRQGDLFGIFFEDLNHAADGGLYGEMVRNRSFEFDSVDRSGYHGLTAWETVERGDSVVQTHVESADPLHEQNRHYLALEVLTAGDGGGIRNEGYHPGFFLEKGKAYHFSCFCRLREGKKKCFRVRLEDAAGTLCYAESVLYAGEGGWEKLECTLCPDASDAGARLTLLADTPVRLELDMISLFPAETFLGRPNGMRKDIAEMLAAMKPKFMRFPGGCLVHIGSLDARDRCSMYRWKNTLGAVEQRPARRNTWNYNQTLGLGFFEFFRFCEDIGAKPLPVISAGYDPHYLRMVPTDGMQEWIDEALDLIEFANGSADTKWGAVRAQMGHPEPFGMEYLGIGNEEVGEAFFERYEIILHAVKEKYPEIQVIGSAGPGSAGSEFTRGWEQARRTQTSLVDEHFYQCPDWFVANAYRYEDYPEGPRAFLGEYASHDDRWENALAEAAFMIGMEKAGGAGMACYAPLLNNAAYADWTPTLLSFDNGRVYGSPSYYVQKLFMNYMGEFLIDVRTDGVVRRNKRCAGLTGMCRMRTDRARVCVTNMEIQNRDTGERIAIEDFMLSEERKEKTLAMVKWRNYEIQFCFRKENGRTAENLNGQCAFRLDFAMQDEENRLYLQIDGWQRLTSLGGVCHGKNCDMGLHHFVTERNQTYTCRLVVQDGTIRAFMDGAPCGEHTCLIPEPDDLYYSAVQDEAGNVIVKLANLTLETKRVRLVCQTEKAKVKITSMSGFLLTDRNSFEEPEKVSPVEECFFVSGNQFVYQMPEHSFAVLQFIS